MENVGMELPKLDNKWNINTVVSIVTLATVVFGGGIVYSQISERTQYNYERTRELAGRVTTLESTLSGSGSRLSNLEWRVDQTERTNQEFMSLMRQLESAMSSQASDIRSTRETLERLERSMNSALPTPRVQEPN